MSHHQTEAEAKVSLPITPMLDMTFQLLFFFVMNFNPADLEGQMDMALPSVDAIVNPNQAAPRMGGEKNRELDFPSDLTVLVRTGPAAGRISALFVRKLEGKNDPVDGLDGLKRYLEEEAVKGVASERITILGDSQLQIQSLMKVMDVCKAAGFRNTRLVKPDEIGR